MRWGLLPAMALALSACTVVPESRAPVPSAPVPRPAAPQPTVVPPVASPATKPPVSAVPVTPSARSSALSAGPALAELGVSADRARAALAAFRLSCPALIKRTDSSGLTSPQDWAGACQVAPTWPDNNALGFFSAYFETATVGDGSAFATGYYEPEIAATRTLQSGYYVPIYRRPPDLIEVDLGQFSESLKGKKIRGRVDGMNFIPYYDRGQIESGMLSGKGLEIAWAADPIEFFFLQIQGSGRLRLPDGSIIRVGYDGQNGRDYVGIGGMLRDRGVLQPGQASMQGIISYLRAQPDGGRAIMNENKSYVFFRELSGGPVGALGVEVTPRATVAADPAFVPLGAPILLSVDRPEANGIWVAQDTGGAIKGANRFDTFWGAGEDARTIAGGMSARGRSWLLLPIGTVGRLKGGSNGGSSPQP
jgi:membrane-bound lytic murein transglycosylase A